MSFGPEYEQVERLLIEQLSRLGWEHLEGAPPGTVAPTDPGKSGRASFSEVFLTDRLKAQLRAINRGPDGRPWLDEHRISQVVGALDRIAAPSLLEANQAATELLLNGMTVDGLPSWDGGRDQRVNFIDWDNPLRNDFVVVSQFRVDIPGTQGRKCITPDEVLFVNGIPLALVECKKPGSPME
jgi:type I restriction enzyme R subunit